MSNKYRKLTEHLANRDDYEWRASFSEVEEILGFPLPESARTYPAWWANQMRSQSLGWQGAGWKATDLDLRNEQVTFLYVAGNEDDEEIIGNVTALTIAEAKAGLAATFGVDPTQIEIIVRA